MCVQNFISSVQRFMSYQQCSRFRTTVDFDREYLWNWSSNRQAENGVSNRDFFPRSMKTIWTLLYYRKKTLTFDLWPWKSVGFVWLPRYMFLQKFIKLSAAVHELSCYQREKTPTKTIQSVAAARTLIRLPRPGLCAAVNQNGFYHIY